ncbi:MAG: ammonium transporter [Lentisphaerae bacterium GWF2_45_14]|nr:MAG: ammonium transporter [Lentisphaerae bacterium GWF2_45_14]
MRPSISRIMKFSLAAGLLPIAGSLLAGDLPVATGDMASKMASFELNMDILWTLIAAFLVFFMQAGFAMVESGFTRAKNTCNIMMKNLMDFSIASLAWWAIGFGLMFGGGGNGLIGFSNFFSSDYSNISNLNWTFFIFQCMFAGTASTIVSGAMAERTKFLTYLIYSAIICGIIYPVAGHWFWGSFAGTGGGWFTDKGFVDFAGSTVVHSCGGWLALAGAIVLGPRIGKYSPAGRSRPIPGHNISLGALGVFILWFGWFGFNPGSTMKVSSEIGYIALTTNLAAVSGAMTSMITAWIQFKKPDVSMTLNGVLAGLVAVTAGCAAVTPIGAVIIGGAAGVLVVFSVEFIDKVLKIDDPVGAVSVHGVCGTFGTIALSFFLRDGSVSALSQFWTQLGGAALMFIWAFPMGLGVTLALKYTIGIRVSESEELRGLDITEHGNEAYNGFQIFVTH